MFSRNFHSAPLALRDASHMLRPTNYAIQKLASTRAIKREHIPMELSKITNAVRGSLTHLEKSLSRQGEAADKNIRSSVKEHITYLNTNLVRLAELRLVYFELRAKEELGEEDLREGEFEEAENADSTSVRFPPTTPTEWDSSVTTPLIEGINSWQDILQVFGLVVKDKTNPVADLMIDEKLRTTVLRLLNSAQNGDSQEFIRHWKILWQNMEEAGIHIKGLMSKVNQIKHFTERRKQPEENGIPNVEDGTYGTYNALRSQEEELTPDSRLDWSTVYIDWLRVREMKLDKGGEQDILDVYSEGWRKFMRRTKTVLEAVKELRKAKRRLDKKAKWGRLVRPVTSFEDEDVGMYDAPPAQKAEYIPGMPQEAEHKPDMPQLNWADLKKEWRTLRDLALSHSGEEKYSEGWRVFTNKFGSPERVAEELSMMRETLEKEKDETRGTITPEM